MCTGESADSTPQPSWELFLPSSSGVQTFCSVLASKMLGLAGFQAALTSELAEAPERPVGLEDSQSTHSPGLAGF